MLGEWSATDGGRDGRVFSYDTPSREIERERERRGWTRARVYRIRVSCDWETGEEALVRFALPLSRVDRRADRVEVSAEQLALASDDAERRGCRVVGWYHSHPHITKECFPAWCVSGFA